MQFYRRNCIAANIYLTTLASECEPKRNTGFTTVSKKKKYLKYTNIQASVKRLTLGLAQVLISGS